MSENRDAPALPSAIERLAATGPYPPDLPHLMLYGRLVGAWEIDWVALDGNGAPIEHRRGEWHFSWVLGGRGVQDVIWTVGGAPENDGTTLRCWDPEIEAWRAVFMSPGDHEFVTLIGRPEGDRIVQDVVARGADGGPTGPSERWTFSEITGSQFRWEAETSTDGGRTWAVTHQMRARRLAP